MSAPLALWLGVGGAALSVLAIGTLPYGYYTFNRVAITVIAVFLSVIAVKNHSPWWLTVLVPVAVLWNPALPIHLDRETWTPLNLVAGVALLSAGLALAHRVKKTKE